jgi:hypothetical protein
MPISDEADTSSLTYKITIDGNGVKVAKHIDAATATEILSLVMSGSTTQTAPPSRRSPKRAASNGTAKPAGTSTGKTKRRAGSPGIVKELSLRPKGKTSLVDFVAEKQPSTHQQKQALIVYWLRHIGDMSQGITVDHVNTCYLEANWPRPTNLPNALAVTSKRKGWLDTSDMSNIRLTTRGEDEIKHNLPPKQKK